MSSHTESNKRIMKNTLMLYVRMIFMMVVSLFTSRVILNVLGVDDYGIYNVVGGVVAMFSSFSGMFSGAISRFLTYELGKKDTSLLNDIFSTSVTIQIGIAVVFFVLSEIVGIYLLNYQLVIPEGRILAANWVLQCSIISFSINLISTPYNAAIIAHEKMSAFAYISIIEVSIKLLIVYALYISPVDKLISYAILLMLLSVLIRFIYGFYCKRNFSECRYKFSYNKSLLKEMSSFAGWNLLGSGAYILNTQGVNILINMFFGVVLNAARGIANQVDNAIMQFVNNFMTAIKPQITKSIASNDFDYTENLVCQGSKFGYFLMLLFFVPIFIETPIILELWLKTVPEYTVDFVRLSMIASMIDLLGTTISSAVVSTGQVKKYFIVIGSTGLLVFPLTYICFKLGFDPQSSYFCFIGVYFILLFLKLERAHSLICFSITKFIKNVLLRIIPVTFLALGTSYLIVISFDESIFRLILVIIVSLVINCILIYVLGLNRQEREYMRYTLINKIIKH